MMENIRAYTLVFGLTELVEEVYYLPADIAENPETAAYIRENGFEIYFKTELAYEEIKAHFENIIYVEQLLFREIEDQRLDLFRQVQQELQEQPREIFVLPDQEQCKVEAPPIASVLAGDSQKNNTTAAQKMISVNVDKLDNLMNLVGELMITESMVTQCPEVEAIQSENFHKASLELHKITVELQDMVMSIRMVPLSTTFVKMNRIVRDMCKKLHREVVLDLYGEETEVDKNIIEHISDPLMHIIRNAIDHGIESEEERLAKGILIMVEQEEKVICVFADELLGQQQVVVKALPNYVNSLKKILGLAGCTLLPDGSISLIMDVSSLTALRVQ